MSENLFCLNLLQWVHVRNRWRRKERKWAEMSQLSFRRPRQTLLSLLLSGGILTTYYSLQQPTTARQSQRERNKTETKRWTVRDERQSRGRDYSTERRTEMKETTQHSKQCPPRLMQSLFGTLMSNTNGQKVRVPSLLCRNVNTVCIYGTFCGGWWGFVWVFCHACTKQSWKRKRPKTSWKVSDSGPRF